MAWSDDHHTSAEPVTALAPDYVDALEHAQHLINYFNSSLRPGDAPRTLHFVRPLFDGKGDGTRPHDWQKHSLVTERGGYDLYKCSQCGKMGKRHGLSPNIIPNPGVPAYCKK